MHYRVVVLLFLMIYAWVCDSAGAQPRSSMQHFSTSDGLSDNKVMCMLKDKEGFMWFGTWTGINRFDGHRFVTYKSHPGDESVLSNNRIDAIVEDKAGFLWLKSYDKQVYCFDKRTEKFLSIAAITGGKIKTVRQTDKIIALASGAVCLQTKQEGVFLFRSSGDGTFKWARLSAAPESEGRLPSDSVSFVHEDSRSLIWVATNAGVRVFSWSAEVSGDQVRTEWTMGEKNVVSVGEDEKNLWLGTAKGFLYAVNKKSFEFTGRRISGSRLNAVHVSHQRQVLYCASSAGEVFEIDRRSGNCLPAAMPGKPALLSIYEDHEGLLWIQPEQQGVIMFNPAGRSFRLFTQKNYSNYLHDADEYDVFEDVNGIVWTNMKGCGFGYYNRQSGEVEYFYNMSGNPDYRFSNMVSAHFYDPCGILWLSSDDGGIEKVIFQPNDFGQSLLSGQTYYRKENEVRGIGADNLNRLWVGTKASHLYVFSNGQRVHVKFLNEPAGGIGGVYSVLADQRNNIWLGTKGNGLLKAVPVNDSQTIYRLVHFVHEANDRYSISSDIVYSLMEDKKGRIWAGTFGGGLNLIEEAGAKVRFIHRGNLLKGYPVESFNRVRHLALDRQGNIWIGTTDGLLVFNPDLDDFLPRRFARYVKVPGNTGSLGDNDVQFIYRDSRDLMWVCTSSGGLNQVLSGNPLHSLRFRNFSRREGLPSDYLLSCAEDNRRNLWLATQNGLTRFDLQTYKVRNFDAADGLPVMNFAEAAALKMKSGELVFGTSHGYIRFMPSRIADKKIDVNIALTNFQVNSQDVLPGLKDSPIPFSINNTQGVTLRYDQNLFSIDYSLLDYRSETRESYAYRLLGFDSVWHNNKEQRRATYTNLPPGKYTFQVKSNNSELYSNVPQKELKITILPPPWRTWWAWTIYVLVASGIMIAVRRTAITMFRLRQGIIIERKLTDLKLAFFTNISHELRTPLTLIVNPLEEVVKNEKLSAKAREHLHVARRNAGRMVRFVNQLLDLRKVQSGKSMLKIRHMELVEFAEKITGYFADQIREKKMTLRVCSSSDKVWVWADAEKMDIVLYNLLANAFKYSPEGKHITLRIDDADSAGRLAIEVTDEGCGVPEADLEDIFGLYFRLVHSGDGGLGGTGIGLALSKEFIELHGGRIYAKNNEQGGLTVRIELRTGRDHFDPGTVVLSDIGPDPDDVETAVPEQEQVDINPVPSPPEEKGKCRPVLLLVEDNSDMRSFLTSQLSAIYRVEVAGNGEDGLLTAVKLLPDLIISDVMMPKMDGITMLDSLKNNDITSHIPIILLSAKISVESKIKGLRYGADYYITKPFSNELLLTVIDSLIRQRRRLFRGLLAGKIIPAAGSESVSLTSHDERFLKELMATVDDHIQDSQFNIDLVADTMNMSRSAFYKKLKSLTNMAPVEFVKEIRLDRAIRYLGSGEHDIAFVASSVGFKNAKYFATCFRQRFNMTPSEYIKRKAAARNSVTNQ